MLKNAKDIIIKQENGASCRQIFWPMMAVFYALFLIRNVFSVEFPVSLYLIWIAVMSLVFNDTEIKALIISFIPLVPGFQSKYAVLVCMILLLLKYCKRLKIPQFVLIVPLLMFWEYLHLSIGYSSVAEYLSGFAPLMCLAVIVSLPSKHEDISFFSRVLALSLTVGCAILLANTVLESHQSLLSLIQEGFRFGALEEAEGHQIVYNANGLGFLCNMVIVGLLINVYFKRAKKIDYFLMTFAVVVGCLTVSRTFLLCLAGTILLYVFLQEKSTARKMKIFVSLSVIIFVCVLALKITVPGIIENYVERFSADDITGGRADLQAFYNDFITSSPKYFWYGIGVQNIDLKIRYLKGVLVEDVPHNGYQQMILAWGVVGLFLMMIFIFFLVLYARKKNTKASIMCYLPLILLLINILAGQFITSGMKLLSLVYIFLIICNGRKTMEKGLNGTK